MITSIEDSVNKIMNDLPKGVKLVAAAKGQSPIDVIRAVKAGVEIIGENYIKDAKKIYNEINGRAKLHFIGIPKQAKHDLLRTRNLQMFDMIETIDSINIAEKLDEKLANINKEMPTLIEVNSGKEPQKGGVLPGDVVNVIKEISGFSNIKILGLMTMGSTPHQSLKDPKDRERTKKCFRTTKKLFDEIQEMNIDNVDMKYLSMGMSNSYKIAIKEGANIVRVGSKIFGKRDK